MKKWLIKQEWSKTEEEQSVVRSEALEDDRNHQRRTNDDAEGRESQVDDPQEETPQEEAIRRHDPHETEDEGANKKSFMRLFLPDVKPSATPQVWAGVTVAATHLGVGYALGLCTTSLPPLTHTAQDDHLRLTSFQTTLFSSVVLLGAALGSLVTALPQVWVGQRVTLLIALPLALASWVTMAATSISWLVVAGRALQGFTMGLIVGPARNYVVELCHTNLRGTLLAALTLAEQLGWLVVYVAGASGLPWQWVALACGCLSTVIPFAGLLFLPDSPRWLAAQDRPPEALKSLMFFRGSRYDSHEELTGMFNQIKKKTSARDQLRAMEDPNIINVLLLFTFLHLASNFTGNIIVCTNIIEIFRSLKIDFTPTLGALILGAVGVMGSIFNLMIVERVGRKPLLVASYLFCSGALAMLGSYVYDQKHSVNVSPNLWLPLTSLAIFSFFSRPGLSVLSLLREELLPTCVRSTAVAFLYVLFYVGVFVASQTYAPIVAALGQYGVFWLYGGFNLVVAVVGGFMLTETRGRSLEEISAGRYPRKKTRSGNPYKSSNMHLHNHHHISNGYRNSARSTNELKLMNSPRIPFNRSSSIRHSTSTHRTSSSNSLRISTNDSRHLNSSPRYSPNSPRSSNHSFRNSNSSQRISNNPGNSNSNHVNSNGSPGYSANSPRILTSSPRRPTYVHRKSFESCATQTDNVHFMADGSERIVVLNLRNTYV